MAIQFNLLPDVKLEYIKAVRRKRVIILVSTITATASFLILVLLFSVVQFGQKNHIANLDEDIDKGVKTLQSNKDLDTILTVQNQLVSMPNVHDPKVYGSRFVDYLVQLTPANTTISDVDINFTENKMEIEGNADALSTVNKFIDTMKYTEYAVNNQENKKGKAFTSVVLDSFEIEDQRNVTIKNGGPIAYKIVVNYDPEIFKNIKDVNEGQLPVTLVVPNITSTNPLANSDAQRQLFAPTADQQRQSQQPQGAQ
jgi:hypothetical protein